MESKVKEKLKLLQKEETECHQLIENFKGTLNQWFLYGSVDNKIFKEVLNSCVEIILHGIKYGAEEKQINTDLIPTVASDSLPTAPTVSTNINNNSRNICVDLELNQIIDEFQWLLNTVSLKRTSSSSPRKNNYSAEELVYLEKSCSPINIQKHNSRLTLALHVALWLQQNISEENVCGFLLHLLNEKKWLKKHYNKEALLRQEKYVIKLLICLRALESRQYHLLSEISAPLTTNVKENTLHKRTMSQPNLNLISNTCNLKQFIVVASTFQQRSALVFTAIRKTKSFSAFLDKRINIDDVLDRVCFKVPSCKAINTIKQEATDPQSNIERSDCYVITSSSGSSLCDADNQPTTSQASSNISKSPLSNFTINSNKSAISSLISTSVSSTDSNNAERRIELISTDDIKIWTDYSWEIEQKNKRRQQHTTASFDVPTTLAPAEKPCKSLSPLNSFFSTFFSTPPTYTSWFVDHDVKTERDTPETAIESIIPDSTMNGQSVLSSRQQTPSLSLGSTVFDKFLPIDGKKVRHHKTQNLFDDVNTTLDYSGIKMLVPTSNISNESSSSTQTPVSMSATPKNCQSLTTFLQMSHLSRNNTDLEKENAHFRISEAIISAIEHIKWNKLETQKHKSCFEATPLATDCLSSPDPARSLNVLATSSGIIEGEHTPYAELEEVSYDLLSAEVVGLSLISKFDEKHLPKVSELKWLVSDDDTPQKLLPMPDLTSSANPDEHVIHSATRGTRYWAPPRQQIIFTDHPTPHRKEQLKRQNYRCAGCGMRVSPQYIHSFRYCTYLGKYHCTGCHRNQISSTPAKILQAWDFKCYPVSVFAYRLLEQMYAYPLFYVPDLNPALYIRHKSLLAARNKRLQLKYVKDFIRTCRFALREQTYFDSVPDYVTSDIDNWSMSDFIDARTKCLHRSIDELINKCENHIYNCALCTARGFLCEYCHAEAIIYPWSSRVERCDECGTCYHRSCWKSMSEKCCRCQRIDKRKNEIHDDI